MLNYLVLLDVYTLYYFFMRYNRKYEINDYLAVVNDFNQLELFSEKMENDLKYKRRKSRTIASKSYTLSPPADQVSRSMQKVNSAGTKIETLIEAELIRRNISYAKPDLLIKSLNGKPDFVIPRYKIAIFCDGDFWHGYNFERSRIKNNSDFWDAKIERNILRDEEVTYGLKAQQWEVFRFWEHEIKSDAAGCVKLIEDFIAKVKMEKTYKFSFIDLFAGIGGFRIPLEELGGKCLAFSEIDKHSTSVYKKNFWSYKDEELELGDITKIGKLPFNQIDLIVGGVPCQAWSVAGKMKGFDDPRGKLWHDTIRVVKLNKPKAFIFENVKGLIDPRNKGNLDLIMRSFEEIGYVLASPQLLNSFDFGLPQNRDRVFIVGFQKNLREFHKKFSYPKPVQKKLLLSDIITDINSSKVNKTTFDPQKIHGDRLPFSRNRFQKIDQLNDFFIFCDTRNGHTTIHSWDIINTTEREKSICMTILRNRRKKIYGESDGNPLSYFDLKRLIVDLKENELKSLVQKKILKYVSNKGYEFVNSKNSSGINGVYRVYLPHSSIFSTLTATGTKDMIALKSISGGDPDDYKKRFINEIIKKKLIRKITAKESGKLQGFPDWFSIDNDEAIAKKQFGNAVSTPVIFYLVKQLIETGIFKTR